MILHNDHVLKWMRWNHFIAEKYHMQLAQIYWYTQYEREQQ